MTPPASTTPPIEIVTQGEIAALISEIDPGQRVGTPADLQTHAHILDGTAHVAPVLPLRFGAVVSDRDAVINELLADHEDEFVSALNELEGCAQYVVQGRYVEETILLAIFDESPSHRSARGDPRQTRGTDSRLPNGVGRDHQSHPRGEVGGGHPHHRRRTVPADRLRHRS
jgi:hypothetical protein